MNKVDDVAEKDEKFKADEEVKVDEAIELVVAKIVVRSRGMEFLLGDCCCCTCLIRGEVVIVGVGVVEIGEGLPLFKNKQAPTTKIDGSAVKPILENSNVAAGSEAVSKELTGGGI